MVMRVNQSIAFFLRYLMRCINRASLVKDANANPISWKYAEILVKINLRLLQLFSSYQVLVFSLIGFHTLASPLHTSIPPRFHDPLFNPFRNHVPFAIAFSVKQSRHRKYLRSDHFAELKPTRSS